MAQLRRMVSDRLRTLPENSHASCGVSCAPSKHTISHLASPAILERVVAGISANRRESYLKEIDALARYDAELDLTALQVPTLVIIGEDDRSVLPFRAATFDAVSHSDVLCCLPRKRAVLADCRRVIRAGGRMVFSFIVVAPNLAPAAYVRAVANGPDFIEAKPDYPILLRETGWTIAERHDLTPDYAAICRRQLRVDASEKDALTTLLGATAFAERQASWLDQLACVNEGLLRRELFLATA